jgi:dipeptidyl aminopeptidase/acylaminoacyl peptidase
VNETVKKKFKRPFAIFGLVIIAVFVLLNCAAYRQAYLMTHFRAGLRTSKPETMNVAQRLKTLLFGVNLPRPHSLLLPIELGPYGRNVTIPGAVGIRLGGWYCPASPEAPLVILFHGYGGEKTDSLNEARVFIELGLSVLLVDFRGSGDSSESYTTLGYDEGDDVAAAVQYARTNLSYSKLFLYGNSMGAAAVLRAVHSCGIIPDAIIVEAVFDRMLSTVRNRFKLMGVPSFPCAELLVFWGGRQFGFNGFKHNPVDYAASVRCPILFLHGTADSRAHLAEARHVYDAVPGPK